MRKLLLTYLFLLIPVLCHAAIALDATTTDTTTSTTTQCNFSHAAGASPTLALLWISLDSSYTISGTPTYGGTNMTLVHHSDKADGGGRLDMWLYELHNPSGGTQTVDADFSTSDNHHVCVAQTFTGTDTSDATVEVDDDPDTNFDCGGDGSETTITLDSTASWMVTMSNWSGGDTGPMSPTNYTERYDECSGVNTGHDDCFAGGDSTGNSGSRTHTTTPTIDDDCSQISVELVEPTGGGPTLIMQTGGIIQ